MAFRVVDFFPPINPLENDLFLLRDNWNDWFEFRTQFTLAVPTPSDYKVLGSVKIGCFTMFGDAPPLPAAFEALGDAFFSVGQDPSFYEEVANLGPAERIRILTSLRDFAYNLDIYEAAKGEYVTTRSLMRSLNELTVREQFNRMARGGARLTPYQFRYMIPKSDPYEVVDFHEVEFQVEPDSRPPSNVHVLIGRNGVGKTTLLANMSIDLLAAGSDPVSLGYFISAGNQGSPGLFANLVSVTFSAFDPFRKPSENAQIKYSYIGLLRGGENVQSPVAPKTFNDLSTEFTQSVVSCLSTPEKAERWKNTLLILQSDPIFAESDVSSLTAFTAPDRTVVAGVARRLFEQLSSGHKIVLLTITRLVESVDEKSLVLVDEPEAHLHPPLLAAFVRALSDLLVDRNGVAIIATHSPVVLQEVPRSCVWKIRRSGRELAIERPQIETFGENVGLLTREIFGLEVTKSGFHRMISDAVSRGHTFNEIESLFGDSLGGEARSVARALIAIRDRPTRGRE